MTRGPVLIDLDDTAPADPGAAAPVPDAALPEGRAMQAAAGLAARSPSRVARAFWGALAGLVGMGVSLALWDFVTGLLTRAPVLGWVALGLTALAVAALAVMALREWAAFARLARLDGLRREAEAALAAGDAGAAKAAVQRIDRLYAGRSDMEWPRARLAERLPDTFDADAALGLAEDTLMAPLDAAAEREVEAAARQVATVTALVPLALADVAVALAANLRMVRRVAEVYGGRGGALGAWRVLRAVFAHLVATGAVAVGDDLIGSVAGGGLLSKVSRRFGEGVVNGALTARVGVAAIEVCRPLPFVRRPRPSVTGLMRRAVTGLFPDTTKD
jgi:putative membrane protein